MNREKRAMLVIIILCAAATNGTHSPWMWFFVAVGMLASFVFIGGKREP